MEINVVDTVDYGFAKVTRQLNSMGKGETILEVLPGPNAVDRMVAEIVKRLGGCGKITILRIYAHGNQGIISVASGEYYEEDPTNRSVIGEFNLKGLEPTLKQLTPHFASDARVEFIGCLVASGSGGEQLLLDLARIWNVRVRASPTELPMGTIQFTGQVWEADPGGGMGCTAGIEVERGRGPRTGGR